MNGTTLVSGGAPLSRRRMLGVAALAGAGLMGLPAEAEAAGWEPPSPASPDDALAVLMEGNRRFVAGRPTAPHRDLSRVRAVAPRQSPFAAVLACADSRVPVEILFDQGFGDVFVCRAAGNVATPEIIGSLEFGTRVLGAKVLMVLGHTACGAVQAASGNGDVPGQISSLYAHIRPAIQRAGGDVERAIVENARVQADLLQASSPVIAGLVAEGKVKVVAANYDLSTGTVTMI